MGTAWGVEVQSYPMLWSLCLRLDPEWQLGLCSPPHFKAAKLPEMEALQVQPLDTTQ